MKQPLNFKCISNGFHNPKQKTHTNTAQVSNFTGRISTRTKASTIYLFWNQIEWLHRNRNLLKETAHCSNSAHVINQTNSVEQLTWARVVMEWVFFWSVRMECVMSAMDSPTDHDLWPLPFNISNALHGVDNAELNITPHTPQRIMQTKRRTDLIYYYSLYYSTALLISH